MLVLILFGLYLGANTRKSTQSIVGLQVRDVAQSLQPLGSVGVQNFLGALLQELSPVSKPEVPEPGLYAAVCR